MMLIRTREREVVRALAALVDCNPFLPERMELERRALGDAFVRAVTIWHAEGDAAATNPNAVRLRALVERIGTDLQRRLAAGARATPEELAEYQGAVLYLLFRAKKTTGTRRSSRPNPVAPRGRPGTAALPVTSRASRPACRCRRANFSASGRPRRAVSRAS